MSGLLFVTRRFPPSIGGMETLAADTWDSLRDLPGAHLLAHRGTGRGLLTWLPAAALRTRRAVRAGQVDVVLFGDGVVATAIMPLLGRRRPRVVVMVMGLDLTYPRRAYQRALRAALRRADLVIGISESTARLAVERGVPTNRVQVVRPGVTTPGAGAGDRRAARAHLDRVTGGATVGRPLLGTLGRLVERKGVRWFTSAVLPSLPEAHYVVAGNGPERDAIDDAARDAGVADRVHLLGSVDEAGREALLRGVDVFVQPNIEVPGDVEGFGLVTVEAAMRDTPVIAADLQGLRDAVVPGETGLLVPPSDPAAWADAVRALLDDAEARERLGRAWGERARRLYGADQFGEAMRELVLGRPLLAERPTR